MQKNIKQPKISKKKLKHKPAIYKREANLQTSGEIH